MTSFTYFSYLSLSCLMYTLSIMLISFIHPAMMILTMLFYSIVLCANLTPWKSSYMFPILFFLIMISGLLIIFLYFSSLISNSKTQAPLMMKHNTLWFLFLLLTPLLAKMMFMSQSFYQGHPTADFTMLINYSPSQPAPKMYSSSSASMTLISMFYLLVSMISIIKISTPKIKSMRKMI